MNQFTLNILEFFISYGEQMYICGMFFYFIVDVYGIEIVNIIQRICYQYKQNQCAILEVVYVLTSILQTLAIIGMLNNIDVAIKNQTQVLEQEFEIQSPCENDQIEPLFDTD